MMRPWRLEEQNLKRAWVSLVVVYLEFIFGFDVWDGAEKSSSAKADEQWF